MKVIKLNECGYSEALLGTSLSRNQPPENMIPVCKKLAPMGNGHSKFMEFIAVWLDITAPRYWWQQMATYRIGNSWLSESTMYTITKRLLNQEDFEYPVTIEILHSLNNLIENGNLEEVKNNLPEGFLQRRIMVTNYKALKNIYDQRKNHKLKEWHIFLDSVLEQLEHPEFILLPKQGE
jgi:hypothetical protein